MKHVVTRRAEQSHDGGAEHIRAKEGQARYGMAHRGAIAAGRHWRRARGWAAWSCGRGRGPGCTEELGLAAGAGMAWLTWSGWTQSV